MRADARTTRARLAATIRHTPDAAATINQYRADLKVAGAEDYIRHLVDSAPPLTAEQRDRLAVLLRGPDAAA